jgi:hypothetical protein
MYPHCVAGQRPFPSRIGKDPPETKLEVAWMIIPRALPARRLEGSNTTHQALHTPGFERRFGFDEEIRKLHLFP